MRHLRDKREGMAGDVTWCWELNKYPTELVDDVAEVTCQDCLYLVAKHRRLTAATATRGLPYTPWQAMPLWRLGMSSQDLRDALLAEKAANGSHRPVPETDVPYDEDHPCNDPHF